jgi:hypothetical protein
MLTGIKEALGPIDNTPNREVAMSVLNNAHVFTTIEKNQILLVLNALKGNGLIKGYVTADITPNMSKDELLEQLQATKQEGTHHVLSNDVAVAIFDLQKLFVNRSAVQIEAIASILNQMRNRKNGSIITFKPEPGESFTDLQRIALQGNSPEAMKLLKSSLVIGSTNP